MVRKILLRARLQSLGSARKSAESEGCPEALPDLTQALSEAKPKSELSPSLQTTEVKTMIKRHLFLVSAIIAMLSMGFANTAVAGDGKGCGSKKSGDTAAVVVPALPRA